MRTVAVELTARVGAERFFMPPAPLAQRRAGQHRILPATPPHLSSRPAFTLADILASLAATTLLAALILSTISATRHEARAAGTQAQLRGVAGVTASYAADHGDRMWGFSRTRATTPGARTELEAVAIQAADIIRRRSGRDLATPVAWFATQWYSHLPLADYLDVSVPMFDFISHEDAVRLPWARDRDGFARGIYLPLQPNPDGSHYRWSYSASYQTAPHYSWTPISGPDAVRSAGTQGTFHIGESAHIRQLRLADFAFPSQKVHTHAGEQFAPQRIYWGDRAARVPMLMIDGSAAINRTADSNLGWRVQWRAQLDFHELYRYEPGQWEAPAPSPEPRDMLPGRYRFTRGGPAGRDFGGPEIDTSGW